MISIADRKLIVTIIGDDTSLQRALTRSTAATAKFGKDADKNLRRGVTTGDAFGPLLARTKEMKTETEALGQSLAEVGRGGGDGMGSFIARAGLATIAINTAYQASRRLTEALETTGQEAFTTSGRIKNLGAALLSGDIIGGIQALTRLPETLEEAGISASHAAAGYDRFRQIAGTDSPFAALAREAVKLVDATNAAENALTSYTNALTAAGRVVETTTGKVVAFKGAVDDAAGLRGPGLAESIQPRLTPSPTSTRIARELGPTARNLNKLILAQANEDLQEVLRLQVIERDRLAKAVENATGNRQQRIELNEQFARSQAAVVGTQRAIEAAADAAAATAKAARDAAAAARKAQIAEYWSQIIGGLSLGLSRAELTKPLDDDLARLRELEAGLQRQIAAGHDVLAAQNQLVVVSGQIASTQQEITANRRELVAARQFRAFGVGPGGEEFIPGIKNLRKQFQQLSDNPELVNAPKKLRDRLELIGKELIKSGKNLEPEVAKWINDVFGTIRSTFDKQSGGPLTKGSAVNAGKILEGLGLSPDLGRLARSRISALNEVTGRPTRAPTGRFVSAAPVVVENHNTIQLDSDVVARNVTVSQQKAGRRNPPQKRGANRSGI